MPRLFLYPPHTADPMETLANEIHEYLKYTWYEEPEFADVRVTVHDITCVVENYGTYIKRIVPKGACSAAFMKYIHKERILYDQYHNDEIACFLYEIQDEDSSDTDSMYSESELETDSEPESFINGFKIMDEYDYREQLTANEFTGGYWDPSIHWVVSKERLLRQL